MDDLAWIQWALLLLPLLPTIFSIDAHRDRRPGATRRWRMLALWGPLAGFLGNFTLLALNADEFGFWIAFGVPPTALFHAILWGIVVVLLRSYGGWVKSRGSPARKEDTPGGGPHEGTAS